MSVPSSKKFFCFLDVLGFSAKLRDIGLSEMYGKYERLIDRVKKISGVVAMVPDVHGHIGVCSRDFSSANFSDSIIVWTEALGDPTARIFTELVSELLCDAVDIDLPLRGSISYGEMICSVSDGVFIGEPILDAVQLEGQQNWIGISFCKDFSAGKAPLHADTILPFKSHYKNQEADFISPICVDWPRKWRNTRGDSASLIKKLKAMNVEPRKSHYYKNTIRFVQFSEQNENWYRDPKYKDGEPFKPG